MNRIELDDRTVATLRKLVGTQGGRKTISMVRARYSKAMSEMGFSCDATYHGFVDCHDMAVLENEAA